METGELTKIPKNILVKEKKICMGNNLNVGLTIPPYSKIKVYWDEN
jgi:hypothetical protein